MKNTGEKDNIAALIARAPRTPGVYLWKDNKGTILYAGKAIDLRARLRNYLASDLPERTFNMTQAAATVEWITTSTAKEALLLEASIVKKNQPRFNVKLKDDKRYPYLCVSTSEMFPRIFITRQIRDDGNRYFGPYTDVRATRNILSLIHKIFPIRKRPLDLPLKKPARPCMNFHIRRCLGPCQGTVPVEEYAKIVQEILLFLEGRSEILENTVRARMDDYAAQMEYEKASIYRDMIANLRKTTERQSVMSPLGGDEDVIGLAREHGEAQIALFEVRSGRLIDRKSFAMQGSADAEDTEIVSAFIRDYYPDTMLIPRRITTLWKLPDRREIETALQEKSEHNVRIHGPRSPDSRSLLKLAARNAALLLKERILAARVRDREEAVDHLAEILHMKEPPSVIECYDISHIQGHEPVASGVMFVDGAPHPAGYRHYRIKYVEGINDPGMIKEVIARRLMRLLNEEKPLPDLVVIDGGHTQLSAACEAAASLGAGDLPMIGLAKKREEIYLPGDPLPHAYDPASPGLRLIRRLRDEAHRFGVTYHRKRRNRAALRHILDGVPDLGRRRMGALLQHLAGTRIERASVADLEKVPGIGPKLAARIREFLDRQRAEVER